MFIRHLFTTGEQFFAAALYILLLRPLESNKSNYCYITFGDDVDEIPYWIERFLVHYSISPKFARRSACRFKGNNLEF